MTHFLAPTGITPAMLRAAPRRVARVALTTDYRKYERNGFNTPSGRVEIYAEQLRAAGEPALPLFRAPPDDQTGLFPLLLTSAKTPLFCHSQHRNLPRLRRHAPDPLVEMSPATAASRGVSEGDWVTIRTSHGSVRARARLNPSFQAGIVAAQHGWWQGCEELGLPGHDPFSAEGANINLVIGTELADPISGAVPHRRYPCEIEKIAGPMPDETTEDAAAFALPGERQVGGLISTH
jgi:anaerobic selenocysteine-containing dehydrogenase